MNAGEYHGVLADPNIVSDDGVALERQLAELGCKFFPAAAHDVEWICTHAAHTVVCTVHDEFNALCYRAEFADDELVTQKLIVVRDVRLEVFSAVRIVIISIVTDDNVGPRDDVFDVNELLNILVWVYFSGVGSCHAVFLLSVSEPPASHLRVAAVFRFCRHFRYRDTAIYVFVGASMRH